MMRLIPIWPMLAIMLLFLIMQICTAGARTITVDDNGDWADFRKIQSAVDSAEKGDTVHVFEGRYTESIDVNASITIRGNGSEETIVDANGGYAFKVESDEVSVKQLRITGAGYGENKAGILVDGADDLNLDECCFCGNLGSAVKTTLEVKRLTISGCTVESNNLGEAVANIFDLIGSNITIKDTDFLNNTDSLLANLVNIVGTYVEITDCSFINNAGMAIRISGYETAPAHTIIEDCVISGSWDGISLVYARALVLRTNISDAGGTGIWMWGTRDSRVMNTDLMDCGTGIQLRRAVITEAIGSSDNYISGCGFYSVGNGISINSDCIGNEISYCSFSVIDGVGIYLKGGSNTIEYCSVDIISETNIGFAVEMYARNQTILDCAMTGDGFYIRSDPWEIGNGSFLIRDCTVNDLPVRTYIDESRPDIPGGFGQAIIYNCTDVEIDDISLGNSTISIQVLYTNSLNASGLDMRGVKRDLIIGYSNNISIDDCRFAGEGSYDWGLWLTSCRNINITRSAFVNYSDEGLSLMGSCSGLVYSNIFFGKQKGYGDLVYEYGDVSLDHGSIGNWWSGYTGKDEGGDGLGDTPIIKRGAVGNITDDFPLMALNGAPPRGYIEQVGAIDSTEGSFVVLNGSAIDDGAVPVYVWRSSLDGLLQRASASSLSIDSLSNGTHTITLHAIDDDGYHSLKEMITVDVNGRPRAWFDETPARIIQGESVEFMGGGVDDSNIILYKWTSSLDGALDLGPGNVLRIALTTGIHNISLSVKDDDDLWSREAHTIIEVLPALPDLVIENVDINPVRVKAGDMVEVNATVRNIGYATANCTVALNLSGEVKVGGADVGPGGVIHFVGRFWPDIIGTHDLKVEALCDGDEIDHSNNLYIGPLSVLRPSPDLELKEISLDVINPYAGEEVELTLVMDNYGLDGSEYILVQIRVDGVPFSNHTFSEESGGSMILAWVPAEEGSAILSVHMDPYDDYAEFSEDNNNASLEVRVIGPPLEEGGSEELDFFLIVIFIGALGVVLGSFLAFRFASRSGEGPEMKDDEKDEAVKKVVVVPDDEFDDEDFDLDDLDLEIDDDIDW